MAKTEMNEIDARAADWAARFDGAAPGPDVEQALDRWLAEDVRHVGAFARAQAMLIAYGDLAKTDSGHAVSVAKVSAPNRRRMLWGSGMAAGLAALGVGGVWLASAETAYATALGERRTILLKDGASLTLNTLSAARVREGRQGCRVRFLDGEILVRTGARDTTVVCDNTLISATDAEFGVQRSHAEAVLTVVRGNVSVEGLAASVGAGGRVRLTPDAPVLLPSLDTAALDRSLAWRTGRLAFEGDTLQDAAAAFGRYSATPLVLADEATAKRRITGLFAANDPVAFARAVAVTSGLRAETRNGRVYLSAPVS